MSDARPVVGFVGIGVMGASMTMNLLRAGYRIIVNDLRTDAASEQIAAGAQWANTAAEAAARSDVVFTCLPSLEAIEAATVGPSGILEGMRKGGACFETSTNSLALLKKLNEAFLKKGCHLLDAPISGGALGAKRGRMAFWVGGDRAVFNRFRPVLKAMGDKPTHVGAIGAGLVTKLVHNSASQAMQAALAEVFVLGVKAGAEPLGLWKAIRQGSIGRRRTFDGLADEFLPANFDPPHASLEIVEKDLKLATELGRELRVPMRIANLALADILEAMNRGWGGRDARSVMLLPQERAGVSIKVDPALVRDVFVEDPPAPSDAKHGDGI
jgi:3-hydroxyisobutyrate dehydrogenase-like beta-hydroxyacid dehydrogenase